MCAFVSLYLSNLKKIRKQKETSVCLAISSKLVLNNARLFHYNKINIIIICVKQNIE